MKQPKLIISLFFLLGNFVSCLLLTGCDTVCGFSRSAEIKMLPDMKAVENYLNANKKITEIRYEKSQSFEAKSENYYFSYSNLKAKKQIVGVLSFTVDNSEKKVYYSNYSVCFAPVPKKGFEGTWEFAKEIENDLINILKIVELKDNVKVVLFGFDSLD